MKTINTCLIFAFSALIYIGNINAQNIKYTAHEWGTFTSLCGSDGSRLSGLYKEEEALPNFVYSIGSNDYTVDGKFPNLSSTLDDDKGWNHNIKLENVNIKMETPVIYFYTPQTFSAKVNVHFNKGMISQYYPCPSVVPSLNNIKIYALYIDFSDANNNNSVQWD